MGGSLNQDEIDALLRGINPKNNEIIDSNGPKPSADARVPKDYKKEKETGPLVEKVEFAPLKSRKTASAMDKPGLDFFNSIPLMLSGELGTAEITVRDLLKLEEGSLIKLNKMAGESATILLNNQYLGQGEVVIINDRFGLRITSIGTSEAPKELKEEDDVSDS
ncbi:MAG: FliM/FliN family flagellar motor switch protein [Bacillota bacterium]|nr:FliM/FliN family flagellar motor switch protein [Bacillota bacterium]